MDKVSRSARDQLVSEAAFVQRLSTLDRGELAVLKRNAGNTLAEARNALWFYRLLDEQQRNQAADLAFLIGTLYGLNSRTVSGSFGTTMRLLSQRSNSVAVEDRFLVLLDSQFDRNERGQPAGGEAAFRLRQLVKLAASKEVGVDWPQLLHDLRFWSTASRYVQKHWAEDFFAAASSIDNEKAEDNKHHAS